jgi:hypothetical protein
MADEVCLGMKEPFEDPTWIAISRIPDHYDAVWGIAALIVDSCQCVANVWDPHVVWFKSLLV